MSPAKNSPAPYKPRDTQPQPTTTTSAPAVARHPQSSSEPPDEFRDFGDEDNGQAAEEPQEAEREDDTVFVLLGVAQPEGAQFLRQHPTEFELAG